MECIIEFNNPLVRFEFCCKERKQSTLIDILLKYAQLNLPDLASILDIPTTTLQNVYQNDEFLKDQAAANLAKIFLIFIAN